MENHHRHCSHCSYVWINSVELNIVFMLHYVMFSKSMDTFINYFIHLFVNRNSFSFLQIYNVLVYVFCVLKCAASAGNSYVLVSFILTKILFLFPSLFCYVMIRKFVIRLLKYPVERGETLNLLEILISLDCVFIIVLLTFHPIPSVSTYFNVHMKFQ